MQKHNFTRIIITLWVLSIISYQNVKAQQVCIDNSGDQKIGEKDGYHYELWNQNSQGTACMTLGNGGQFSGNWSGVQNYLGRRGIAYDRTHIPGYYGIFFSSYNCTYSPNASAGNSYLGVYGWMHNPSTNYLVEYYIIEDWRNWNPSMASGATLKGTFHCDGADYDVIQLTHNGPSIIDGITSFQQYVSVRKTTRNSGNISISNHFKKWEQLGMPMANLHEVSMLVEGYQNSGTYNFTNLSLYSNSEPQAQTVNIIPTSYNLKVGEVTSAIPFSWAPANTSISNYYFESSNPNVASVEVYKGNFYLKANGTGTATLTLSCGSTLSTDQATITVTANTASRLVSLNALGVKGDEQIALLVNNQPIKTFTLTKNLQTYTETVSGTGNVTVEFLNDDGVTNGRDVRLDYIMIDGVKRETEAMAENSAVYQNGTCGGSYSEWLNCSGAVNYGPLLTSHTITIRARGNKGGEHIDLLINGQPVNNGWWLGTTYQEYTATVTGDGDINVEYDNDGGQRDAVIDWVRVDSQTPRQAENMEYNTGAFANGVCGGGSYTQWLHCNGVIGFGNISDNFGSSSARIASEIAASENKTSRISVYPNPSSGNVSIELMDNDENTSVHIYDAIGRIVYSRQNISDNVIRITDLKRGVYMVNVKGQEFKYKNKLVVY